MGGLFRVSKDLRKAITILAVTIELYFFDYSTCLAMSIFKSENPQRLTFEICWVRMNLTPSVCFSSLVVMWPYVAVIQKFLKTQ